jgi:uncharacterized membrane protein
LFGAVVTLAALFRILAAFRGGGLIHADEHQQYLEVAQGLVYGPHAVFWEYQRGTRNLIYPGAVAAMLWLFDRIGVQDPIAQAACIRAAISLAVLATVAMLSRQLLREGRRAAGWLFLLLGGLTPIFVSWNVHPLSETASTVPILLAVYLLRERPTAAGLAMGLAFGIRIQSVFLIAGFLLGIAWETFRDPERGRFTNWRITRLSVGLLVGVLLVGLVDRLTWGHWFHSVVQNVRFSVVEGGAAGRFGGAPPSTYLRWYVPMLLTTSPLLIPLMVLGATVASPVALAAAFSLIGHSLVAHKEFRFLFPIVPLLFYLTAIGFEIAYARWQRPAWRRILVVALAGTLIGGAVFRLRRLAWNLEPSRSNFIALRDVGKIPDLTGVAVYGLVDVSCGNYFYLRRDVPLITQPIVDLPTFRADRRWREGKINYLLAFPEDVSAFDDLHPSLIERVGPWGVYKIVAR